MPFPSMSSKPIKSDRILGQAAPAHVQRAAAFHGHGSCTAHTIVLEREGDKMTVRIIPNEKGNPAGKLADAELHFDVAEGLEGLKLIGFGVWERRGGGRNVTFPARQYSVNGERRSFALLRPALDNGEGQEPIKSLVLEEYAKYQTEVSEAVR
jgi:hypothetical protein